MWRRRLFLAGACLLLFAVQGESATSGPLAQNLPEIGPGPDGSVSFSIPVELPLATGAGPAIAVAYHSAAPNGLAGQGMALTGLDSITRDPSYGIEFNGNDHFRSAQHGELVASGGAGEFRARTDRGVIFRASGVCGDGPCTWSAILPDGQTQVYGASLEYRVAGPTEADGNIAEWALERSTDRSGNSWVVEYEKEGGIFYPDRIRYSINPAAGLTERSIDFTYEQRPDVITAFLGRPTRMARRLVSIRTSAGSELTLEYEQNGSAQTSNVVRIGRAGLAGGSYAPLILQRMPEDATYSLRESSWPIDAGQGPVDPNICTLGMTACLNTIGGANVIASALCALFVLPNPMIGTSGHISCMTGDSQTVADVNGDGRADFVRATGLFRDIQNVTYLNESGGLGESATGGQFVGESAVVSGLEWQIVVDENGNETAILTGEPLDLDTENLAHQYSRAIRGSSYLLAIVPYTPTGSQRYYVDVNGDGKSDFVRPQGGRWLVSYSSGNGFNAPFLMSAPRGTGIKTFRMWADMNGDGKSDYVRLLDAGRVAVALSNGSGFSSDIVTGLDAAGMSHQVADVNGDGFLDFVRFKSGVLLYNRGRADGSFDAATISQNIDTGYEDFQIVVDMDGDGVADYLRIVGNNREWIALSPGNGKTFGETRYTSIAGGPVAIQRPTVADMNGDGKLEFVLFEPTGGGFAPVTYSVQDSTLVRTGTIGGSTFPVVPAGAMPQYSDTNGDGSSEVLFPGANGRFSVVSRPAHRPGLVTAISNSSGKQVQIAYAPAITSGANASGGGSRGNYSVVGSSAPQFLVTAVEVHGSTGPKSRTEYTYTNGRTKLGPTRRESKSLGFESVTARSFVFSSGSWQANSTYTSQRFHQEHPSLGFDGAGLPVEELVRKISDDSTLSRTTYEFARPPGFAASEVVRIAQIGTTTTDNTTRVPITSRRSVLSFDSQGNPERILEEPDTASPGLSKLTELTYAYPAVQPAGQVTEERVTAGGAPVSCKQYDADAQGRITSMRTGIACGALTDTASVYNAAGKPVRTTTNGMTTEYEYDAGTQNHAVRITMPGGLSSEREVDPASGRAISETDGNGIRTVYDYDSFGRKTSTKRGTLLVNFLGTTLEANTYDLNSDGSGSVRTERPFDGIRTVVSETHFDEWGQTTRTERGAPPGWFPQRRHTISWAGCCLNHCRITQAAALQDPSRTATMTWIARRVL